MGGGSDHSRKQRSEDFVCLLHFPSAGFSVRPRVEEINTSRKSSREHREKCEYFCKADVSPMRGLGCKAGGLSAAEQASSLVSLVVDTGVGRGEVKGQVWDDL